MGRVVRFLRGGKRGKIRTRLGGLRGVQPTVIFRGRTYHHASKMDGITAGESIRMARHLVSIGIPTRLFRTKLALPRFLGVYTLVKLDNNRQSRIINEFNRGVDIHNVRLDVAKRARKRRAAEAKPAQRITSTPRKTKTGR